MRFHLAIDVVRSAVQPIAEAAGFEFVSCTADGTEVRCKFYEGDPAEVWSVRIHHHEIEYRDERSLRHLAKVRARRMVKLAKEEA